MRDKSSFQVSSFCAGGGCLGMAETNEGVELIDVGDEDAGHLLVSREAWAAFVAGAKAGEFDLPLPRPSEE